MIHCYSRLGILWGPILSCRMAARPWRQRHSDWPVLALMPLVDTGGDHLFPVASWGLSWQWPERKTVFLPLHSTGFHFCVCWMHQWHSLFAGEECNPVLSWINIPWSSSLRPGFTARFHWFWPGTSTHGRRHRSWSACVGSPIRSARTSSTRLLAYARFVCWYAQQSHDPLAHLAHYVQSYTIGLVAQQIDNVNHTSYFNHLQSTWILLG